MQFIKALEDRHGSFLLGQSPDSLGDSRLYGEGVGSSTQVAGSKLQIADCRLAHCPLSVAGFQVAGYRSQVAGRKLQVTGYRLERGPVPCSLVTLSPCYRLPSSILHSAFCILHSSRSSWKLYNVSWIS